MPPITYCDRAARRAAHRSAAPFSIVSPFVPPTWSPFVDGSSCFLAPHGAATTTTTWSYYYLGLLLLLPGLLLLTGATTTTWGYYYNYYYLGLLLLLRFQAGVEPTMSPITCCDRAAGRAAYHTAHRSASPFSFVPPTVPPTMPPITCCDRAADRAAHRAANAAPRASRASDFSNYLHEHSL